jgi:hypothetical protein
MAATDLYDAAVELLAAAQAALADTPGGPITVAYVSEGLPAFDCIPQLTVHAGGPSEVETAPTSPSLAPGRRTTVGMVDQVALTITVVRCAAIPDGNGNPPPPSAHSVPAQQTMADVWAIWNHLASAKRAGTLFGGRCREMFLDPSVSIATSGGAAGWEIPVRVQLNGYRPEST